MLRNNLHHKFPGRFFGFFLPWVLLSMPGHGQSNVAPLVEYRFNETGVEARNTGLDATPLLLKDPLSTLVDLHSLDGAGVSGLEGDRAFDNTASTGMGNTGQGGIGQATSLPAVHGLISVTLQGWFKTQASPLNSLARLFDTYDSGQRDLLTLIGRDSGNLQLVINRGSTTTTSDAYGEVAQWIFFAVTYDGTLSGQNAKFYKGTAFSPVSLVETRSLDRGRSTNHTGIWLGNTSPTTNDHGTRPVDGWMDNFRIFGSTNSASGVLTLNQLEAFRVKDVLNLPDEVSLAVGLSNQVLTLTWPAYPGGFALEEAASLVSPTIWETSTAVIVQTNGRNEVQLPASGVQFFRLKR